MCFSERLTGREVWKGNAMHRYARPWTRGIIGLGLLCGGCAGEATDLEGWAHHPANPNAVVEEDHGQHEGHVAGRGAAGSPATRPSTQAVVYACPHHPEVMSMQAGASCPKCGMTLEKRSLAELATKPKDPHEGHR